MVVHLDPGAAEVCASACTSFVDQIWKLTENVDVDGLSNMSGSFDTARQIGTVYSLFVGDDLTTMLNEFADQAEAMSLLFAAAGGLIEAQDEALAAALAKAGEEPAGLQSLGLIHAAADDVNVVGDKCVMGAYGRVGPEDVSGSPLEEIARCAQGLQPEQFQQIAERTSSVSEALDEAATQLHAELNGVLGDRWQGEFATRAQDSVRGLVTSAHLLSGELGQVATKAQRAQDGFLTTRTNIAEYAASGQLARASMLQQGPGLAELGARSTAQLAAAEEQARAIVNTEYSPAVMAANLDDLDFTAAYRVVSGAGLDGASGVDLARVWNTDALPRPASPAPPNPATLAALTGGTDAAGAAGAAGGGGVTTTNPPVAPTDAVTEQALLASKGGGRDGVGAIAASAGPSGAGAAGPSGAGIGGQAGGAGGAGGVNAATTPAAAPFAPASATGQTGGAASGIRGARAGGAGGSRDRGFGSAAGAIGGSGAAAAGAGAARMGGAGTLAGIGSPGGPAGAAGSGMGGPTAGVPGAGSAAPGAAGAGGQMVGSSSSPGAQAGRAGAMPMGGMMGAAGAGQSDRRGHTPAGYLTNATNTTDIIGEPVKVAPAVLGRTPTEPPATESAQSASSETSRGRVIGRDYTGDGSRRP